MDAFPALSELGRKGYTAFWSTTIARYLLSQPAKRHVSVREISDETYIQHEDIVSALKEMHVLEQRKKGPAVNKAKVREWAKINRVILDAPVDRDAFLLPVTSDDEEDEDEDDGDNDEDSEAEGEEDEK